MERRRKNALVALFAMLLQVLFATEHASAMAAAAARGGSDGTPIGFLDICTAQGFMRIPAPGGALPNEPANHSTGGHNCAVCGSAAITGAASIPVAAEPVATRSSFIAVAALSPTHRHVRSAGLNPFEASRAPPSL